MLRPRVLWPAAALTLVLALTGCNNITEPSTSAAPTQSDSPTAASTGSPKVDTSPTKGAPTETGTAVAALEKLPVKGRAAMTGYSREMFGAAWLDADRNGCDTRNDILQAFLANMVIESNGCVVTSGDLADPYTATTIHFVRGNGTLVDIDHVVALGNAWATGATGWEMRKRAAIANDPLNLLPVDAGANRQKGDGDAATWLPANKGYRCEYVARQIAVKAKYGLWVTQAEKDAMNRVLLGSCPKQPLSPDTSNAPVLVPFDVAKPSGSTSTSGTSAPANPSGSSGSVSYENCDAVRAAGAAPIRRGDPGYSTQLDRDGDGIACE